MCLPSNLPSGRCFCARRFSISPSDNWDVARPASERIWLKTCRVRVHHRRGPEAGLGGTATAAAAATQQICSVVLLNRGVGVGAPTDWKWHCCPGGIPPAHPRLSSFPPVGVGAEMVRLLQAELGGPLPITGAHFRQDWCSYSALSR